MRVDLRCKVCQAKLAVKSELAGKSVRCPKCANPVRVTVAPVVLPQIGNKAATPMMAVPVNEEPVWAEVLPEDNPDFEVLPDEAPMESVPVPLPPKPKPSRPAIPQTAETAVAEQETAEETPRPKKKKKKKNKMAAKAAASVPTWVWILGGIGAAITTGGIILGLVLAMRAATPDGDDIPWREYAIIYMISVPISLVILIASMFISSALGGGINFGDAKTAIIGALFLILIVNAVSMIQLGHFQLGRYLALLVWLVGFMTIFGLDPWEARFLLIINGILNYAVGMALFHYMINHVEHEVDPEEDRPVRTRKREPEHKRNNQERGFPKSDEDEEQGYFQPEQWHDRIARWVASQDRRNTLTAWPG